MNWSLDCIQAVCVGCVGITQLFYSSGCSVQVQQELISANHLGYRDLSSWAKKKNAQVGGWKETNLTCCLSTMVGASP